MKASEYQISKDKFVFVNNSDKIHDKELVTKPVSYLADAFNRFKKNKASIIAAVIIFILVLFAIVGPWTTPYTVAYQDEYYAYCLPKSKLSLIFFMSPTITVLISFFKQYSSIDFVTQ